MNKLAALVNELETKIIFSERQNPAVSKSAVGWHIQHSLLVAFQIIHTVEKSNPLDYRYQFNLRKILVYTLSKIPRGKAKAPDRVMPKEAFNTGELKKDIELLKSRLTVLNSLHPKSFFRHPYFGSLHLKDTIKMLKLHSRHHLDIINDIIG